MNTLAFNLPPAAHDLMLSGNGRVGRAWLLSLVFHSLLIGFLIAPDARRAEGETAIPVLRIAMHAAHDGQPVASEDPSTPASAPPLVPPETADTAADILAAPQTPVVAGKPLPAPARIADSASAAHGGPAAAVDGMDLMFFEYVRETYEQDLNRWLRERGTLYPPEAREQGLEGNALVAFSLDREGRVLSLRIGKSTGSALLDEAALETIRRAAPFPPPPEGLPFAVIEDIYLPVRFRLEPPAQ